MCTECDYSTDNVSNLYRHVRIVHEHTPHHECSVCGKWFNRKDNMHHHMETHEKLAKIAADQPSTSASQPVGVDPDESMIWETPPSGDHTYVKPRNKRAFTKLVEESPRKRARVESDDDDEDPVRYQQPDDLHPDLDEIYEENWRQIRTHHRESGRRQRLYNFRLQTATFRELEALFERVHKRQLHQYRINYAFGYVLYNNVTGEHRYYHASHNIRVMEQPMLIENTGDLDVLNNYLNEDLDILEYARRQRPNSQWVVKAITNVLIYVNPVWTAPLGKGKDPLPNYIVNNKAIIALDKDRHNPKPFNDNLCLFRCLALHQGATVKALETPTTQLFYHYLRATGQERCSRREFPGVFLYELGEVEDLYKVNIQCYTIDEKGQVTLVRRSVKKHPQKMYLNVHGNHFSYIQNFRQYSKLYKCRSCTSLFKTAWECQQHERRCSGTTKHVFHGGVFKPPMSIFEKLENHGITIPKHINRIYPYRATYDIECYMKPATSLKNTEKLEWVSEHEVASISVCSNVPDYTEVKCFVSEGDPQHLVQQFVDYLDTIAKQATRLIYETYQPVTDAIQVLVKTYDEEQKDKAEMRPQDNNNKKKSKKKKKSPIENLFAQYTQWQEQLPVVGFNSGKYDINAMRNVLFPSLMKLKHSLDEDDAVKSIIKKQNSYMGISTKHLKIIDILNFLSPATSYANFLKAFKVPESKGAFPYEWFTSLDKLQEPTLPPHTAFYSKLKKGNITETEYQELQTIWTKHDMKTMRDFLIWYNNQDVKPFLTAIEKMSNYYASCQLDLLKDAISLPGLAMQDLFSDCGTFFSLIKEQDKDLHYTMREQIVGGPSIIFNRYHEKGKTRINEHRFNNPKLCDGVVGLDANALYLWAIIQPMPTGFYARRKAENQFKLEQSFTNEKSARDWLSWKRQQDQTDIIHRHKNGREVKIGHRCIPVDGLSRKLNKIYQFHGCLFHGHQCWLTKGKTTNPVNGKSMEELHEKTVRTTQYLKDYGYEVEEIYECQWINMKKNIPQVKHFVQQFKSWSEAHKGCLTEQQVLQAIVKGDIFGLVECDIKVPDHLRAKFDEMPPIFKNTEVSREDIGEWMKEFAEEHELLKKPRRSLIGSFTGDKITLITPLLRWYIEHGLVVNRIHQIIEYIPHTCFEKAAERVSEARRAGDADPDKSIIAEMDKLKGNSYYGKTATRKEDHTTVKIMSESQDGRNLDKALQKNNFHSLSQIDEDTYEVISSPKQIKLDLPLQVAFFVYGYAKLRMLEFYYDFMLKCFDPKDFEYCEMDTDSAYIAFSNSDWISLMKPEEKVKYITHHQRAHELGTNYLPDAQYQWFPRSCCPAHIAYDKRTPGLFKTEWEGDGIIGLCSKTYFCFGTKEGDKSSAKGIQKRRNAELLNKESYLKVLLEKKSGALGLNRGFRCVENKMYTYQQARTGLNYFYPKRKVLPDGRSTVALDI